MLVILTDEHILFPQQVCQTCLLADKSGQPRWYQGQLRCGQTVLRMTEKQPEQYECQMGFRLVDVD